MTSRERILATLRREPVDRVPVDLAGAGISGIAASAYHRLRLRLGLDHGGPVRVKDIWQFTAEVEQSVLDRLGADCVGLPHPGQEYIDIANDRWKPYTLFDGTRAEVPAGFDPIAEADGSLVLMRNGEEIGRMPKNGFYFDRMQKFPGALHPDLDTWRPPRKTEADMEFYHQAAEALYTGTDKAIIAGLGPPYQLFNTIGQGGYEDWMITLATEPEYVKELHRLLVDAWIDNLTRFYAAVGDRVAIIITYDDFGTQRAPFISEAMFREYFLPAYKRAFDWIHRHTPWKVMLHSDGAIFPFIPGIIEMGADILNPVQTTATGMIPERLKADFGDRLVFWGGSCDCQNTLTFGKPEEVAAEVRANVGVFARGGGYVCSSVHNIQANVPADNIIALFDTAREFDGLIRSTSGRGPRP